MRRQLRGVLASAGDECKDGPYVFASGAWGPKAARTWALAYDVWLGYHGVGGAAVVIDAYLSENGSARLAGRGGGEMSGHVPEAEQLSVGQVDSVRLLVHGVLRGSSGRALNGRAALYTAGPSGVRTIWQTRLLPGLRASVHRDEIVLTYVDAKRFYPYPQLPNANVLEFYVLENGQPKLAVKRHY